MEGGGVDPGSLSDGVLGGRGGAWSLSEWVLMGVLDPWVLSVGVKGLGTLRAQLSGTFLQTLLDEGALFISAQLSSDAVSALRQDLGTDKTVEAT